MFYLIGRVGSQIGRVGSQDFKIQMYIFGFIIIFLTALF